MISFELNDDGTMTKESIELLHKTVDDLLQGEKSLMEALQMSQEQFEALYAVAYNTYVAGKYEDAASFFGILMSIQPFDARVYMGFAASLQMQKNYENAALFYQWACGIDQQDPNPMYHSAECYMAMKDIPAAKSALTYTLKRIDATNHDYTAMRNKVEVMLANLTNA